MLRRALLPLCAALAVLVLPARAQSPDRTIAVTFDDLPIASRHYRLTSEHRAFTRRLLAALARHGVRATGFVVGNQVARGAAADTARMALLRRWVEGGHELGNHTHAHPDLHVVPVDSFARDVDRADALLRQVLAPSGAAPRWFRHPYLHTGRTIDVRRLTEAHLGARGYRVAPATVDGYDYTYNAAYEAALLRGDRAAAARLADEYVAHMARVVAYWEGQSRALFGREIAQVLLLHANLINADTFDRLARMLRERGYRFVTLDEALADAAYAASDTYTGPSGPSWLRRWALTRGLPATSFIGEPQVPADVRAASLAPP